MNLCSKACHSNVRQSHASLVSEPDPHMGMAPKPMVNLDCSKVMSYFSSHTAWQNCWMATESGPFVVCFRNCGERSIRRGILIKSV